ncbi:MAG: response regulator transcription factor [Bacteroidales bacterium]|nr:response regulator transcription factor [Bacteroidales bacterium]
MRILVVEDSRRVSDFLVKGLEESGFGVVLAETGLEAQRLITEEKWDIILLDIMLPDIDGLELLQYARFKKNHTPILALSALNETDDKVKALEYGADDYLSKPYHFKELIARIQALTRRVKQNYDESSNVLSCDNLTLYVDEHRVVRGEKEIKLTLQEFKLLKYLLENKNRIMSRTQILNAVWGYNYDTNTNVVDVYISYLRNKIDITNSPKLIETIKGIGYRIRTSN